MTRRHRGPRGASVQRASKVVWSTGVVRHDLKLRHSRFIQGRLTTMPRQRYTLPRIARIIIISINIIINITLRRITWIIWVATITWATRLSTTTIIIINIIIMVITVLIGRSSLKSAEMPERRDSRLRVRQLSGTFHDVFSFIYGVLWEQVVVSSRVSLGFLNKGNEVLIFNKYWLNFDITIGVIPCQVSKVVHPNHPKFAEIFSTYLSPQNMTLQKFSAPQIVYKIFERHFKLQWKFN